MSSYRTSLLKKNLWLYFFSFLIAPTGYIVKIIVSGDVSIEELGVLYGIISFVTILSAYNDFGMTESMNYFLPEYLSTEGGGQREKGKEKKYNTKELRSNGSTDELRHGNTETLTNGNTETLKHGSHQREIETDSKIRTTQILLYALSVQMLTSAILGVLLFFGAPWLAEHYFQSENALYLLRVFILFFFGENLFKTLTTFFQAAQSTKLQKGAELIRMLTLVAYVVGIFMADLGTLEMYAWGWVLALGVGVIFSAIMLVVRYRTCFFLPIPPIDKKKSFIGNLVFGMWHLFDGKFFKGVIGYAVWVVLTANAATILSQIDMQMIIAMLGPEEAGYYTNYLSVMRIPFLFLLPGVVFLFPVFSDLFKKNDFATIAKIRHIAYKYFSVLGVMTGSFFFLFGTDLTVFLFGEAFVKSGEILSYSSLFLVFNFLLQIDFQVFSGTGRPKEKMKVLLVGIGLNFVTNLILIQVMGVFGAALATGIGWVFLWGVGLKKVGSDFAFSFDMRYFLKNLLVFGGGSVLVYFFYEQGSLDLSRWNTGIFVTSVGLVYGIIFLLLNLRDFLDLKAEFSRSPVK